MFGHRDPIVVGRNSETKKRLLLDAYFARIE